jgi:hypothetical protein
MRRVSERCQAPFEGRTRLDKSAVPWSASALAKGRPPFRKDMPEAFCSDGVLEFSHDRVVALEA